MTADREKPQRMKDESELKTLKENWDKHYKDNEDIEVILLNGAAILTALIFALIICVIVYCICK